MILNGIKLSFNSKLTTIFDRNFRKVEFKESVHIDFSYTSAS